MGDESELRKSILSIQCNPEISEQEKSKQIQQLMSSSWELKRPSSRNSNKSITLDDEDALIPSYRSQDPLIYGCSHYKRKCKMYAKCCNKWFVCRHCHDEGNDHQMDRYTVDKMICMICRKIQKPSQCCVSCNEKISNYFCGICNFWDDSESQIFHCSDCNICRVGTTDGFVHCKVCGVCLSKEYFDSHKCMENRLCCNCPICGEYLLTSTTPIMFMRCGHSIHFSCHTENLRNSYQCPVCLKSLGDMKYFYSQLDDLLKDQKMPPEYQNVKSHILCNDCEVKSIAPFHFVYHKCQVCNGYNTKVIKTVTEDKTNLVYDLSSNASSTTNLSSSEL